MQKTRDPITNFSKDEINKRYAEVVAETLYSEHDRAERLVEALKHIESSWKRINDAANSKGSTNEEVAAAKHRLETALEKIKDCMDEINFTQYNKLKKAETVIVDLTQVDEQSDMEKKKEELKVPKSYKLDSNTKTFSGLPGERLSQWLFIVNEAFKAQNVQSDQIKLALIANYVKGSVLNALMRYQKETNPSWDGFQKILKEQYEDSNLDYKIRTQFFNLKMENSFPKYLMRFQELLNQIPNLSGNDIEVVYKFTDGLTKDYAFAVRRDKCETLSQAIKVCQDFDCLSRNYGNCKQH